MPRCITLRTEIRDLALATEAALMRAGRLAVDNLRNIS